MSQGLIVLIAVSLLLLVLLVIVFAFLLIKRSPGRRMRFLRDIESLMGLRLQEPAKIYPKIPLLGFLKRPVAVEGDYKGRVMRVFYSDRGGNYNRLAVYVTMEVESDNPCGLRFFLRRRGIVGGLLRRLMFIKGASGGDVFRDFFQIKEKEKNSINRLIGLEARMDLYSYYRRHKVRGIIYLKDEKLVYEEPVFFLKTTHHQRLREIADIMCCLQDRIAVYDRG